MPRKLGRKPRSFNHRIPHMSAMLGAMDLPPPPASVDWSRGITNFGMMLNDQLGDCTCAAIYHARQIWTANTLTETTESDDIVLSLYEAVSGYTPNDPNSDNGANEQEVLTYLLNVGAPLANNQRDKIVAFVEVDPRNIDDVKRTINECGVAYIGFDVPSILMSSADVPALWQVDHNNTATDGGHAIVLIGYDSVGPYLISWGQKYQMTWEFFSMFTDEVYAIADNSWINATGKTPLGLSIEELKTMMHALRG